MARLIAGQVHQAVNEAGHFLFVLYDVLEDRLRGGAEDDARMPSFQFIMLGAI